MTRLSELRHEFVDRIPAEVGPGTLYVCLPYATAVHLCACGCGSEVVTPLTPAGWILLHDGETVTLHPSIGNENFACRSHYWITRGSIEWVPEWPQRRRFESELQRDARRRFERAIDCQAAVAPESPSLLARIGRVLSRLNPWGRRG